MSIRAICADCPDPEPCEADWPCDVAQAIEAELSADKPCERCVFIPTPDGKCICREVGK